MGIPINCCCWFLTFVHLPFSVRSLDHFCRFICVHEGHFMFCNKEEFQVELSRKPDTVANFYRSQVCMRLHGFRCYLHVASQILTPLQFAMCLYFTPGGGDSHMKQTGMLVVSLRGVNFEFWSRLGCSGQSANISCHQGLVQGSAKKRIHMCKYYILACHYQPLAVSKCSV